MKGQRASGDVTPAVAEQIAQVLYDSGLDGRDDKDEKTIIYLLAQASAESLPTISAKFEELFGASLADGISNQFGGDVGEAMQVRAMGRWDYFADALNKAWEGFGTDEQATSRILGRWSKNEVLKIGKKYEEKFGRSLREGIESECSGHYKDALIAYLYTDAPGYVEPEELVVSNKGGQVLEDLPEPPPPRVQPKMNFEVSFNFDCTAVVAGGIALAGALEAQERLRVQREMLKEQRIANEVRQSEKLERQSLAAEAEAEAEVEAEAEAEAEAEVEAEVEAEAEAEAEEEEVSAKFSGFCLIFF